MADSTPGARQGEEAWTASDAAEKPLWKCHLGLTPSGCPILNHPGTKTMGSAKSLICFL